MSKNVTRTEARMEKGGNLIKFHAPPIPVPIPISFIFRLPIFIVCFMDSRELDMVLEKVSPGLRYE